MGFSSEELQQIKDLEFLSDGGSEILFISSEYVQVLLESTYVRKLTLRIQYKDNYPTEPPLIEIKSNTLLDEVLVKLEKAAIENTKQQKTDKIVKTIIEFFYKTLETNKLLYLKEELDKINKLLKSSDTIKLNYKNGTVIISQSEGNYNAKFKIIVPNSYPLEPVEFKFLQSNFHPELTKIFTARVQFLIGKILKGYKYELPNKRLKKQEDNEEIQRNPSNSELHEIRQDLQFLKKVQDLKEQNHDKKMRREHVRLLKAEEVNISEKEQKQKEIEDLFEQNQIHQLQKAIDQRTFYPVVAFIMKELIFRLPQEICLECDKKLLPISPPSSWSNNIAPEMDKSIRVERLSCDHWYHFICLEKIMSRPPFEDKICLADDCNESIRHTIFNIQYLRKMEQRWLKKEERKRELADIADFLS